MALPLPVTEQEIQVPFPFPVGILAELPTLAGLSFNYFGGRATARVLTYQDLTHYAWWQPLRIPDRFGSDYRETLGEILRGVHQSDVAAMERLTPRSRVELGRSVGYNTITRPMRSIAYLTAHREQEAPPYEQNLTYETARELLNRTYPPSILALTQDAIGHAPATAQEIVEYVFSLWAELYPWFEYEPVPPLYWFIRDDEGQYSKTPDRSVIQLRQDPDSPRSMADFIDTLMRTFQGYAFRYNVFGRFEILPAPWAAASLAAEEDAAIVPAMLRYGAVEAPLPPTLLDGNDGMPVIVSQQPLLVTLRARAWTTVQGPPGEGPIGLSIGPIEQSRTLYPGEQYFDGADIVGGEVRFGFTYSYPITPRRSAVGVFGIWLQYNDATQELEVTRSDQVPDVWYAGFDPDTGEGTDPQPWGWSFEVRATSEPQWGIRSRVLTTAEVKNALPRGTLDLSRVINKQTVSVNPVDYVSDQNVLAGVFTKHAAGFDSDHTPEGRVHIPRGQRTFFEDENDDPLILGAEPITVTYRWSLRRSSSTTAPTGDPVDIERVGEVELLPGQSRTINVRISGAELDWFVSGTICQFTFTRVSAGLASGIRVTVVGLDKSPNVLATRPFFCHFVEYDVQGSVWQETGETIEVTYGADGVIDEDDGLTLNSIEALGVREGQQIRVDFFDADFDTLLEIARSNVLFGRRARRRWENVELTVASPIQPADLNSLVFIPNGIAAVMDTYAYSDSRTLQQVMERTVISLDEIYDLTADSVGPAVDALTNPAENAVAVDGMSFLV